MSAARLVIAGTHSGAGKTTLACAIMAALRRRGLRVAPFKVGPDFLDPGYHAAACGLGSEPAPAAVLDAWMLGVEGVRQAFARGAAGADVAVIEGMMGLHDGAGAETDEGSTAQVARLLEAPVVLVLDAAGLARSAGAVALGYRTFDPEVRVAGVVANRVAGEGHAAYLRPAVEHGAGLEWLGWMPEVPEVRIAERHLGLVAAGEQSGLGAWAERLADMAERHLNVARLLDVANGTRESRASGGVYPRRAGPRQGRPGGSLVRVRLALAWDEAFCFYYGDNLALLRAAGAEVVPFSPLRDSTLPEGIKGVYLGGGYPELHAARLAANASMRQALRGFAERGGVIYAECGGFMYLCDALTVGGVEHPMVGLVPGRTILEDRLQAIGYREVTLRRDTVLGARGAVARGHEFHHSRHEGNIPDDAAAYVCGAARLGYATPTLLASYVHLHFGSRPGLAEAFVERCTRVA